MLFRSLLGIATTTGTACVALCVHGPIARQLGVNAGTNCLGPGNRVNASIGRALQLCIRNIGGARSDTGDMATMGQPGKYTLCFAERHDGPFPTLTERQGMGKDASAITVMGISGTAEVLPGDGEGATPEAILSPIVAGMKAALVMSSMSRRNERGEQVFLLPLEMAEKIARHDGWDIARIQRYVFEQGDGIARAPEAIHPIVTGGAGYKMSYLPIWGGGSQTVMRKLLGPSSRRIDLALRLLEAALRGPLLDHGMFGVGVTFLAHAFERQGALQGQEIWPAPAPERQRLLFSKHDSS